MIKKLTRNIKYRKRKRGGTKKQTGGALCKETKNKNNIYNLGGIFSGSTWYVYAAKNNPELIIKKIGDVKWMGKEEIENEIFLTKVASDLKIAPKFVYSTICEGTKGPIGYIVTEKIIGREIKLTETNLVTEANKLLKEFNEAGYTHGDTSYKNAMVGTTKSNPKERVWLIDFGLGKQTPPKTPETIHNI